jgi:hypothetical protein
MKVNFSLPNTRLCIVLTVRDNKPTEHLIDTPRDNDALRQRMLERKIGYSEIRAVKAVDAGSLVMQMSRVWGLTLSGSLVICDHDMKKIKQQINEAAKKSQEIHLRHDDWKKLVRMAIKLENKR